MKSKHSAAGYFSNTWVEHHAVDGKVAACDVFARILAEADFVGPAAVGVSVIAAEGCYFYCVAFFDILRIPV